MEVTEKKDQQASEREKALLENFMTSESIDDEQKKVEEKSPYSSGTSKKKRSVLDFA